MCLDHLLGDIGCQQGIRQNIPHGEPAVSPIRELKVRGHPLVFPVKAVAPKHRCHCSAAADCRHTQGDQDLIPFEMMVTADLSRLRVVVVLISRNSVGIALFRIRQKRRRCPVIIGIRRVIVNIIQNIIVIIFYNMLGFPAVVSYLIAAILGIPVTFLMVKIFAFGKR